MPVKQGSDIKKAPWILAKGKTPSTRFVPA